MTISARTHSTRTQACSSKGTNGGSAKSGSPPNIDSKRRIPYANQSLDRPDVLLADLMAIFHPGLLPDHAFGFLRHVRSAAN